MVRFALRIKERAACSFAIVPQLQASHIKQVLVCLSQEKQHAYNNNASNLKRKNTNAFYFASLDPSLQWLGPLHHSSSVGIHLHNPPQQKGNRATYSSGNPSTTN